MTNEYCKARITALALSIQTSRSSSCLPSLVNIIKKIFELLHLFQWYSAHLQWTLIMIYRKISIPQFW